jgi:hypothetical protein
MTERLPVNILAGSLSASCRARKVPSRVPVPPVGKVLFVNIVLRYAKNKVRCSVNYAYLCNRKET